MNPLTLPTCQRQTSTGLVRRSLIGQFSGLTVTTKSLIVIPHLHLGSSGDLIWVTYGRLDQLNLIVSFSFAWVQFCYTLIGSSFCMFKQQTTAATNLLLLHKATHIHINLWCHQFVWYVYPKGNIDMDNFPLKVIIWARTVNYSRVGSLGQI